MRLLSFVCFLFLLGCGQVDATSDAKPVNDKELIVLATPPSGDDYYTKLIDDIRAFHFAYARKIAKHDRVIILASDDYYAEYKAELGGDIVKNIEMQDIWMRDFTPSNAAAPTLFRYTREAQGSGRHGQSEADFVQEGWGRFVDPSELQYDQNFWYNDGGNFVDDYAGNIVVSRKFLRDNSLAEEQGRNVLSEIEGVENVAFIESDEQGGLEHADGVVAFIDSNRLVINSYPEDADYTEGLKADLRVGLPGVEIHEIDTPYSGVQIYDPRFGSACGLYTNMLVTPARIYLPQFGIKEDAAALAKIQALTDKTIIPVMSSGVCKMGGGVRCMSWQLRGKNAERLLDYLAEK